MAGPSLLRAHVAGGLDAHGLSARRPSPEAVRSMIGNRHCGPGAKAGAGAEGAAGGPPGVETMKAMVKHIAFSLGVLATVVLVAGAIDRQMKGAQESEAPAAVPESPQTIRVGIIQMDARVLEK